MKESEDVLSSAGYTHIFSIDSEMQVQKRHRYTFWELLSDTGGFHDGLCLIMFLFMVPLSSNKFQIDVIDKAQKSPKLTRSQKKKQQKFTRAMEQA